METARDVGPVLEVRGLGKKFVREVTLARRYGAWDILGELRLGSRRVGSTLRPGEFWALQDVDFGVLPGEALGIIGHNGAGKSTLLRLLHGLIRPDAGSISVAGRTSALLDFGAAFNKILTGRENIVSAAAIQGVVHGRVEDLVAAVAEFAELDHVLDTPLWTYSTGMQMRLGYAIAAELSPELLLVDEVIAVGDIAFQRKCVSHIRRYLNSGGSLVLVSHDLWMIQALCSRCLVLSGGRVIEDTSPNRAISAYMRELRRGAAFDMRVHADDAEGSADQLEERVVIESVTVSAPGGGALRGGGEIIITVAARSRGDTRQARWEMEILAGNLQVCVARLEPPRGAEVGEVGPDGSVVVVHLPELPLFPGGFNLTVHCLDALTGEELGDPVQTGFEVESGDDRRDTLGQIAGCLTTMDGTFRLMDAGGAPVRPGSALRRSDAELVEFESVDRAPDTSGA